MRAARLAPLYARGEENEPAIAVPLVAEWLLVAKILDAHTRDPIPAKYTIDGYPARRPLAKGYAEGGEIRETLKVSPVQVAAWVEGYPVTYTLCARSPCEVALSRFVTVSGAVKLSSGAPATNATASCRRGPLEEIAIAGVDAKGRFTLKGCPPVGLHVAAEASGFAPAIVRLGNSRSAEPVEVTLTLLDGASVRGRVTDTADIAIAGAAVHAMPSGSDVVRILRATAPDGSFDLGVLESGTWKIYALEDDCAAEETVVIPSKGESFVPIRLPARAAVTGTVRFEGKPVAGVTVVRHSCSRAEWNDAINGLYRWQPYLNTRPHTPWEYRTDEDGRFRFDGIPLEQRCPLRVDDEPRGRATGVGIPGSDTVLELSSDHGSIEGVIVDSRGQPIAVEGAAILGPFPHGPDSLRRRGEVLGGRFAFRSLTEGTYELSVSLKTGIPPPPLENIRVRPNEATLVRLVLSDGRIRGRLVDRATGAPVASAQISVVSIRTETQPERYISGFLDASDADGRFEGRGVEEAMTIGIYTDERYEYRGVPLTGLAPGGFLDLGEIALDRN